MLILGVVILTALSALAAFACVFAGIAEGGGAGDGLSHAAGELFGFSRVGLLIAGGGVVIYAAIWGGLLGDKEDSPAAPPSPAKGSPAAPQILAAPPPSQTIEHDD